MLSKQKVKYIQTLGQKKFRDEEAVFIAEGPKLVGELLRSGKTRIKEIFALTGWINDQRSLPSNTIVHEVSPAELERISQLSTPNQVLAVVEQFDTQKNVIARGKITLVLDAVQDPGNLGTIIRIADWFAVDQIVCSPDTADMYNSKVVQSTMGSISRVNIFYTDLAQWLKQQKDTRIYAAMLQGQSVRAMKKLEEGIIVLGNESKGISQELQELVNVKITIPRSGEAESLNVAVAAGIILSHLC